MTQITNQHETTATAFGSGLMWRDWIPCLLMLLAVVVAWPFFAIYGYVNFQINGILAATLAAGICWIATEISLLLVIMTRDPQKKLHSLLAGIFFRTGIPLVLGMFLHRAGGPLAEAGLFGMILVYYLLTLAVETMLAVKIVHQTTTSKKAI